MLFLFFFLCCSKFCENVTFTTVLKFVKQKQFLGFGKTTTSNSFTYFKHKV